MYDAASDVTGAAGSRAGSERQDDTGRREAVKVGDVTGRHT